MPPLVLLFSLAAGSEESHLVPPDFAAAREDNGYLPPCGDLSDLILANVLCTVGARGSPTAPDFSCRATLGMFDAGDILPSPITGNHFTNPDHPDDWRMAIAWGCTLVTFAYDLTKSKGGHPHSSPSPFSPSSPLSPSPRRFTQRSPLAAIANMRTPGTHAPAHELLTLAADQFSRGIFHMPHTPPGVSGHSYARARAWA